MEVKAYAKSLRISPRKLRLVVDLVRGKKISPALAQLQFSGRAASLPVSKLLKSAVANAKHNYDLVEDNLFIKEIFADGAATLKRSMPRAQGRATPIRKRTSHLTIVLGELVDSGVKLARKVALDKPVDLNTAAVPTDKNISADEPKSEKTKKAAKSSDKPKEIVDPRREGRGSKSSASGKAFTGKLFQRKSGSSS
jgi:large subunit ribosomal protein L22